MTILKPGSVEVIQHWDKSTAKDTIKSTTIKVGILIDNAGALEEKEFIVISDKELLISEEIIRGTISEEDYAFLSKIFMREVKKEFPNKTKEELDKIVETLVFSVHSTARPYIHTFKGKKGIYSQVRPMGRD